MASKLHLLLGASAATVLATLASPALAQSSATPAEDAASATEDEGLAEIVVTAQRRSENLQRVPLAISAVNAEELANAGVTDVTSLTKLVPSLVVQPATGTSVGFYLRGVGALVGNAFTENPVAFNVGQVYIARPAALLGTFYDLERVEVLKGPQGILYGRNATGGAINVIPRRPDLDAAGADASIEVGNYEAVRGQTAVNLPLGAGAALRVAGQIARRDGYLSDGYDDEKGEALRASLLVEPSETVSTLLRVDYFHQGGNGPGGVLVPSPLVPTAPDVDRRIGGADPLSVAALRAAAPALINPGLVAPPLTDGFVDSDFWGASAEIDVDLGGANLTIIPAYRESRPDYLAYNGGYLARVRESADQQSLEVRLTSDNSSPLSYVLGGYYFDEDQQSFNNFIQGLLVNTLFNTHLDNESKALFGQLTYAVSPTLRLVGGARHSWERKENDTTLTQTSFGVGPTSRTTGTASFKKLTYKAGLEWDAGERNLVYANVATGFKSGGFFIAAVDNTFRPEKITAYTIGSKNRFVDNRLQLNVEAFYWDYNDQQVNYIGPIRTTPTTIGSGLATANAGKSRIYGAEADLVFQLTPDDLFGANLQWLNAKYTDFTYLAASANGSVPRTNCTATPNATVPLTAPARAFTIDCSGKPQINTPDFSLNLSYEHRFALSSRLELAAGARTKIESSRFLSPEYLPEERQDAYMQSDVYLTLSDDDAGWSLTGFVNNLEDETVYAGTSLRPVLPVVYNILRAPRTYGLRAAVSF